MVGTILLVLGIAILFYAALPAVGALFARARWRKFRATVTRVSHYPTAGPAAVTRDHSLPPGRYRFFGTLEAIQGDDRIWLTNGRFSVAADLRNVRVYLIPEMERSDSFSPSAPGASPAALGSVPWNRIFSLPEGTPVFVGGAMFSEEGRAVFRDSRSARLLVVIHDCPRETVVRHAISGGRQRNEYINAVTLPSVAVGSLALVLLAFTLLAASERLAALIALTAGLAPLAPFLPPGVPLYFAYRGAWKRARLLRVQRDVVRLPLRWFPGSGPRSRRATLLPDLEPYVMVRGTRDPSRPDSILSEGTSLELPQGITRVQVVLPTRHRGAPAALQAEMVAFCAYSEDGDALKLRRPDDPMADHVLLPGDPESLARESERAARSSAMVSAAFIGLEALINLPLVFLLLSLVIR